MARDAPRGVVWGSACPAGFPLVPTFLVLSVLPPGLSLAVGVRLVLCVLSEASVFAGAFSPGLPALEGTRPGRPTLEGECVWAVVNAEVLPQPEAACETTF